MTVHRFLQRDRLVNWLVTCSAVVLAFFLGQDRGYHIGVTAGFKVGTESVLLEQAADAMAKHIEKMQPVAPTLVKSMCGGFIGARTAAGCGSLARADVLSRSSDPAEQLRGNACSRAINTLAAPCGQ